MHNKESTAMWVDKSSRKTNKLAVNAVKMAQMANKNMSAWPCSCNKTTSAKVHDVQSKVHKHAHTPKTKARWPLVPPKDQNSQSGALISVDLPGALL